MHISDHFRFIHAARVVALARSTLPVCKVPAAFPRCSSSGGSAPPPFLHREPHPTALSLPWPCMFFFIFHLILALVSFDVFVRVSALVLSRLLLCWRPRLADLKGVAHSARLMVSAALATSVPSNAQGCLTASCFSPCSFPHYFFVVAFSRAHTQPWSCLRRSKLFHP